MGYGLRAGVVVNKGKEIIKARTTPSAGALYPLEVIVRGCTDEMYMYDVEEGHLQPYSAAASNGSVPEGRLGNVSQDNRIGQVVFVARPWLSMKKYGQRGYLYTQLDIGHAAASVALSARALGLRATVCLRIDRQRVTEEFALQGLCREPQVAVTVHGAGADEHWRLGVRKPPAIEGSSEPKGLASSMSGGMGATFEPPSVEEEANWRSLLKEVGRDRLASPLPASFADISSVLESKQCRAAGVASATPCRATPTLTRDHGSAVIRRESAKGFLPLPLTFTQVIGTLFEGSGLLHVDCAGPGEVGVGVRMMVRRVEGLDAGVYA